MEIYTQDAQTQEQRAARDAVMEIPLFPELAVALRKELGYGPHVDMLQHLCYWFHPRHPKMQNRWTLYKTYAEWRDECGLSQRQVNKGRETLRELAVVTEKKGPRGRIFYRVDWPMLAELLSLDTVGVQTEDDDIDFDDLDHEFNLDTVGVQAQFVHQGVQAHLDTVGVQANSGEYAGEYLQENFVLHTTASTAFAEPAEPGIKENEPQEDELSRTGGDSRHSPIGESPTPELAKEVEIKVWALIFGLPNETAVTRFADHYIAGRRDANGEPFTVERVAEKAREHLGGDEPLEAYIPYVALCLEDKRRDLMGVAS